MTQRKKTTMEIDRSTLAGIRRSLRPEVLERLDQAVSRIVAAKQKGGKVVAVLGSGPNLHEGVTTLVAELMHKGLIDGVTTSSAVINHEMGGTLERVKRIEGAALGIAPERLPSDGKVEATLLDDEQIARIAREITFDPDLYRRMLALPGHTIIKVAGNLAYPTGLRTERIAREILPLARQYKIPFEQMAGYGADPLTMIGAGAALHLPVLVTIPQLVGGGEVGLAVGDSLSLSERARRVAGMLADADVIIESALALSQEIHDGPFERYTGHGFWVDWEGGWTYSLERKTIVRIDLDPNLEVVWQRERAAHTVTDAVDQGLPKTKTFAVPFRMEMSGFARIPGSIPIVGDIGEIWPLIALDAADALGIKLDFMCYKQSLPAGARMREWIVEHIQPLDRERLIAAAPSLEGSRGPGAAAG